MSNKKRRGKGEGSIYQTKDGRWRGVVIIGDDPATGEPIKKYFSGKKRSDVARKVNKLVNEIEEGTYTEPSKITVKQYLEGWIEGRKPFISHSTWRTYKGIIDNHLIPALGKIQLSQLRAKHIQELVNRKIDGGRADQKEGALTPRTIKYIQQTLATALEQAVKERLIKYNEAKLVELPKQQKREMRILTKDEVGHFLERTKNIRHGTAYLVALTTGVRLGELLGVTWSDIDFKEKAITVRQQVIREEKQLTIKTILKTQKSARTIRIPDQVVAALKEHRKKIMEERLKMGSSYHDFDLAFCTEEGKPYDPRNFHRYFKQDIESAELPGEIRVHDLRHTFATLALEAGVSPKSVQEILGHTSIKTTLDLYAHVTEEMQGEGARAIGRVLDDIAEKNR